LNNFYNQLTLATLNSSLEDRFAKAVQELTKLIQSGEPCGKDQKLSYNPEATYSDVLKALTDRILHSKALLSQSAMSLMIPSPFGMMPIPSGAPSSGFPPNLVPLLGVPPVGTNPFASLSQPQPS
jgi:hypothetical protein